VETYCIFEGELPETREQVKALFTKAGDLLGTVHHGVACIQTHLVIVDLPS
jgi:hypothetical protein